MPLKEVILSLYNSWGLMYKNNTIMQPASDKGSFFMCQRAFVHSFIR